MGQGYITGCELRWANDIVEALKNMTELGGIIQKNLTSDKKLRRRAVVFSKEQLAMLEMEYSQTRYIKNERRWQLAQSLCLSETQISQWFYNRRYKEKRKKRENEIHSGADKDQLMKKSISNI